MKILIIIPVRMGSKRLRNKNILPIKGRPMFLQVAYEAKKSKYKPFVCVSSESDLIKKMCKDEDLFFIKRPKKLSLDHIEKQDVIVHATKYILKRKYKPNIVISLQVNTPEFSYKDLDKAILFFSKNVFIKSKIREVISVGKDNLQNGAFRIMTLKTVFKKTLSTKVGIYYTDYIDIHNMNDYKRVLRKIESNEEN